MNAHIATRDIYKDAEEALEVLQACRSYLEIRLNEEHFPESAGLLADVNRAIRALTGMETASL